MDFDNCKSVQRKKLVFSNYFLEKSWIEGGKCELEEDYNIEDEGRSAVRWMETNRCLHRVCRRRHCDLRQHLLYFYQ